MPIQAYRASLCHFHHQPQSDRDTSCYEYLEDALLLLEEGRVLEYGPAEHLLKKYNQALSVEVFENACIFPGFVDTHIHFPQIDIIASYGKKLLEWLQRYTFPAETRFSDEAYAKEVADIFIQTLLRHGTTTAMVFGTCHEVAVDALFNIARKFQLRLIAGNVLADRQSPDALLVPAKQALPICERLIDKWHGTDRLQYALTPRFAPCLSDDFFKKLHGFLQQHNTIYLQTHLAESQEEVRWVSDLFPQAKDYLDVYDQHGFLGPSSLFAHGIYLSDDNFARLGETGSHIAFCPSANLFLGSGLFPYQKACDHGISIGLGSDIGAGNTFSLLQVAADAYKVSQLQNAPLSPLLAFYWLTLGGAKALNVSDEIGNFAPGKEADFVILDKLATPLMDYRMQQSTDFLEELFLWQMLGDDRAIRATYVLGECVYRRELSH